MPEVQTIHKTRSRSQKRNAQRKAAKEAKRSSDYVKERLYVKQPGCFYCGEWMTIEEATIDHFYPKSKGGANKEENYVLACAKCNSIKSNHSVQDFMKTEYMAYKMGNNPDYILMKEQRKLNKAYPFKAAKVQCQLIATSIFL